MTNYLKFSLFSIAILTFFIASCGDDEPVTNPTCPAPSYQNQVATGSFMADTYTFVDGSAKEDPFDSTHYQITFYGETPTGDMCDNFNFDLPEDRIIFSLPQQVGTYELGVATGYSVSFNRVVTNNTSAEIALCGEIEIQTITADRVTGRLDVKVDDGSAANFLNGNFDVILCD
ncbi:MAG: hypothetical protein AB8G11_01990 [Saprospiraceae bacterium]